MLERCAGDHSVVYKYSLKHLPEKQASRSSSRESPAVHPLPTHAHAMEKRVDTLMQRIDAEELLRSECFSREAAYSVLVEQDGHVGKSLIYLRGCVQSVLRGNALALRIAAASASAPTTRVTSPVAMRPSSSATHDEDSLDLLMRHSHSSSRASSRSSSSTQSRRPSLVNFSVCMWAVSTSALSASMAALSARLYHSHPRCFSLSLLATDTGRLQHPELHEAARKEEKRVSDDRGPGAYNPTLPTRRCASALITPLPTNTPLPSDHFGSSSCSPALTADLPTPEFAERLARAHTHTSALRKLMLEPDYIVAASRPTGCSSPRKRSYAPIMLDADASRRSVERLHRGSTRSYAAQHDRSEEQRRKQMWGCDNRDGGFGVF